MEVPFPEISIESKCRPAAQAQQEPFRSGKQKERREIKGAGAREGMRRGGLRQSFTFDYTHSFVPPLFCIKKE